jgi:hypothetical protein
VRQHLGQILHAGATQKLSDSKGVAQLVRMKFHWCSIVFCDGEIYSLNSKKKALEMRAFQSEPQEKLIIVSVS